MKWVRPLQDSQTTALVLDELLVRFSRGELVLRGVTGRNLAAMRARDCFSNLGFSSFGDYVDQKLGLSRRYARELAAVASALDRRPATRRAYREGRISYSALRVLLRKTPVEDEEVWAFLAGGRTLAELKAMLSEHPALDPAVPDDDEPPAGRFLVLPASRPLAGCWYVGLELARRLQGADLPTHGCVEQWMAEFLSEARVPDTTGQAEPVEADKAVEKSSRRSGRKSRRAIELSGSARFWRQVKKDAEALQECWAMDEGGTVSALSPLEAHEGDDALALHRRLQEAVELMHRSNTHLRRLLSDFDRAQLYLDLGYPDLEAYAAERLNMSVSNARSLIRLHRRLSPFPDLTTALDDGRLTPTHARLLVPILQPRWEKAWVEHAERTTVVHLKQDIESAQRVRDTDPQTFARTGGLPAIIPAAPQVVTPRSRTTSEAVKNRWDATSREARERIRGEAGKGGAEEIPGPEQNGAARSSAGRTRIMSLPDFQTQLKEMVEMIEAEGPPFDLHKPVFNLRFWLPHSLDEMLESCMAATRLRIGPHATLADTIEACLHAFLRQWGREALDTMRKHPILTRDGWKCSVPTCSRRAQLHVHHLEARSRGGGNEGWNLGAVCAAHHLHGIHKGWIRVSGRAPDALIWEIGVQPDGACLLGVTGRTIVSRLEPAAESLFGPDDPFAWLRKSREPAAA
jgi:hypothetical protein